MGVSYRPRLVDRQLLDLLRELPAVMVTGPRAAGKTTTAQRVAADILRLDEPAVATAVAADPDAALRRAGEPVLLDEWQEVPSILGAVKRAVDDDPRPGRFILTGSVEADQHAQMWPATGRVVRLVLHGLTQREIAGVVDAPGPMAGILSGRVDDLLLPEEIPDVDGYVALALRGGFPEMALRLGHVGRQAWVDAYLDHVVTRDVQASGEVRDPVRLRRYLEVLGLSTAGLPADATLYQAANIDQRTARAYDRLLARLHILDQVPPWFSSRLSRLVKRPKRYLTDAALAVSAARVDEASVLLDGDLLGRVLDTFVAAQLRPEMPLLGPHARLHHLRTESGRQEIDLVIDLGAGRIAAFEVKATSSPSAKEARHLAWFRDQLGDRFVAGIVLHTGRHPFPMGDRIWALPICTLWSTMS